MGSGGSATSLLTIRNEIGSLMVTNVAGGGSGGTSQTKSGRDGSWGAARTDATAGGAVTILNSAFGGTGGASSGAGNTGGLGGGVGAVSATGTSLLGAKVSVEVIAGGGEGGRGLSGARSGDGGDTTLTNAVSGTTSGELVLKQQANGGQAGTALFGSAGGRGGYAESSLAFNHVGSSLNAQSIANGGYGGIFSNAPDTRGGDARAVIDVTGAGSVSAEAGAYAGYSYATIPVGIGSNGSASASAIGTGFVQARALASGGGSRDSQAPVGTGDADSDATVIGPGGRSVANARAFGSAGTALASARALDDERMRVSATVSGSVKRGTAVTSVRNVTAGAGISVDYIGVGAGPGSVAATAVAVGDPRRYIVDNALQSDPNAAAVIDPDDPLQQILLFGEFANDGGTNSSQEVDTRTTSSVIELSVDPASLGLGNQLVLAFIDPQVAGNGFDSLTFRAEREGVNFLDLTFSNAVLAAAYFDDNVLLFDAFEREVDGALDLRFILDVTVTGRDDYFATNFLVTANVVPLPSTVWLLGTAVGLLGWRRWRTPGHGVARD